VRKTLEAMGLNWSVANTVAKGQAKVQAEIRAPRTQAGGTLEMAVTAHNTGNVRSRGCARTPRADNGVLDRREFVYGQLLPGEKRTWTVPIKIPRYMPSREGDVTLHWGRCRDALEEAARRRTWAELPRPAFAWSYQVVGNDGLLHKGEKGDTAEIIVDVKNVGTGTAFDAYARWRTSPRTRST